MLILQQRMLNVKKFGATLNGQFLLQFEPLSNKNFSRTGVGVNCNFDDYWV